MTSASLGLSLSFMLVTAAPAVAQTAPVPLTAADRDEALTCGAALATRLPTIAQLSPTAAAELRYAYARWTWKVARSQGVDAIDIIQGGFGGKAATINANTTALPARIAACLQNHPN